MNAIIFYQNPRLVGSLIDAMEYFLYSFLYNKDVYLLLPGKNPRYRLKVIDIIKNRYSLYPLDNGFESNIVTINSSNLFKLDLKTSVILDYGSIPYLKCRFKTKKLLVISELYTESEYFFFDKKKYNVEYYGEMPFVYSDFKYTMKFLFEFFSPCNQEGEMIYINSPGNDIENDQTIQEYLKVNFPEKEILQKNVKKHKENLFEYFDTYLYYHANKYFDPHPRLFHESSYYNKSIIFENPFNVDDGASRRYKDLIDNGLNERYFSKEDEIVKQLIRK